MVFDVSAVVSTLTSVSVASLAIGAAVAGLCIFLRAWHWLDGSAGGSTLHWDQREGESYEEFVSRNRAQDAARK